MPNPLMDIPAAPLPRAQAPAGNPLMNIPAAPLERRGFSLGTTLREGVQDIGRIGLALPAIGEQLVSSVLDVPEGSTPASDTLRDMAAAEASRRQMEAAGKAEASLPTRIGEGATRSAVGMVPSLALAPAVAAAGAAPLAISAATAAPGALSAGGNKLGADLNDPDMGPGRRLARMALEGGLEFGGELLPMGKLGLGPEARLARAIAGRGAPVGAARVAGDVAAEMGQEALTGGAQSVASDLTGTQPVTAGEVLGNAGEAAGMGAATALPLAAGMGAASHTIGALQERQAQLELQRQQGARQVADAFNPDRATNGALPADGPGPVSITPDVVEEVARHPEVTGAQAAEAIDLDQQAVADAVSPGEDIPERLGAELSLADEQVRAKQGLAQQEEAARRQRELAGIADEALGEKPRDPPPEPPDLAAEAAKKTLADQERVQNENRERDRRKLAFALREDLGLVGNRMGGHFYDSAGKLQFNEEAPNRAARMGPERAKAFVQEVLGDDQGAMAGDDPTATPAAVKFRMEEKPLAPEQAAGVRTSTPPPAPTAADIVALPPAQRMEAFRKLSPEVRAAIQPEISRLMQEQRHVHGFNDNPVPAAVPAAKEQRVPGQPGRRAKGPAHPLPAASAPHEAGAVPAVPQPVAAGRPGEPVPAGAAPGPGQPRAGGQPVPAQVTPEASKQASAAVPSQNAATKTPAAPVADPKEVSRLARISKAVLPSSVAVTEHGDHVRITYPGGATIQVRPVADLPLDPAAWHDSVAKVKGALSGAFSRAGLGSVMPSKAAWLKLPKATQAKVMAELPPVAAVTDISGRRVGVSREALVRLVSPAQRTDAQLADAIEEEDHHVLFAGLLTNEERTTVRDELARARPELAKEDPASRVVMEAGYEHWRAWNQDRQKALASPKTTGVFRKLAERIRTLLRWFDRTPTVPAKTAAQVWESLGAVRERGAVTPAAGQSDEEANATLRMQDDNESGDKRRREWAKANGERPPKGESWKQLEERSAKIDKARRLQGRSPEDVITDKGGVPYRNGLVDFNDPRVANLTAEDDFHKHISERILDSGSEPRMWRALARAQKRQQQDGPAYAVPQALNEIMPAGQRQAFDQWQKEADAILADPERVADMRSRAQADAGLSPAEQVALRRLVSEQLSEATTSGNKNRWQEALETASLRKAAGARVARELASRRLDLSTPEGRREAILSYTAEMGSRWQNAYNRATTKRDRAAVVAKWQAQQERIHNVLKERWGIDLADPRVGEIFSDAYSVGRLFDAIGDAGGSKFSLGNLVGYYTAGNLLTAASFAVNLTGYPMMGAIAGLKGVTQAIAKHLLGMQGNRDLTSVQGAHAAARAGFAAIGRGLANGATAFWTGRPQAEKQAKPISEDHNDLTRSTSPIKNPFLRAATAPFLEANRFVDEMFWTIGYNGALAAAATEARMAGDKRSHREMIDNPDADLVERATQFADWLTLRTSDRSKLERGVAALRSPTALEDAVDIIAPGMGKFTVNPLYFTMPFFSAIARLTVEGAKISPYGMIGNIALGAKRLHGAARADDKATSEKLTAQSVNNLAYTLGGLALMGLALVPGGGGDDKRKRDLVTGSPSNYKSAGERAINEAVEQPRTIGGVDYSRFDPIALPLSLHADMRDALRELQAGKADVKTLRTLGEKAFNAAIERQFLSGLSDLFKPQFDEHGDPKGVLTKFGENVTGMLAPGRPWISSYRKITETQKMDRPRGDLARAYDAGTPSRDMFGEHEQTREDSAAGLIGSLFVTPKGKASPEGQQWQQRIHDLNAAVEDAGGKPWFPSNPGRSYTEAGKPVRWTDEQYDRVKEIAGAKWLAMLRQAKALDNADLPPERQLKIIQALREQANQYAAGRVRTGR